MKDFFSLHGWANVLLACSILGLEINFLRILKDGEVFMRICSDWESGFSYVTSFLRMSSILLV